MSSDGFSVAQRFIEVGLDGIEEVCRVDVMFIYLAATMERIDNVYFKKKNQSLCVNNRKKIPNRNYK